VVIKLCCQHQTSSGEIFYRNVISWHYVRLESEEYKNLLLKTGYDIPVEILKETDKREQRYRNLTDSQKSATGTNGICA